MLQLGTVQIRVLKIGILGQKYGSHRFLKHLVKFRNWGAEVSLYFYRAISKTRISTVSLLTAGRRRAQGRQQVTAMILQAACGFGVALSASPHESAVLLGALQSAGRAGRAARGHRDRLTCSAMAIGASSSPPVPRRIVVHVRLLYEVPRKYYAVGLAPCSACFSTYAYAPQYSAYVGPGRQSVWPTVDIPLPTASRPEASPATPALNMP